MACTVQPTLNSRKRRPEVRLPQRWTRASPSDPTPAGGRSLGDGWQATEGVALLLPRKKKLRQDFLLYLPIQCWERNLCRYQAKIIRSWIMPTTELLCLLTRSTTLVYGQSSGARCSLPALLTWAGATPGLILGVAPAQVSALGTYKLTRCVLRMLLFSRKLR